MLLLMKIFGTFFMLTMASVLFGAATVNDDKLQRIAKVIAFSCIICFLISVIVLLWFI